MKNEKTRRKPPENQPQFSVFYKKLFKYARIALFSPCAQVLLVLLCLIMMVICFFSMFRLHEKLDDRINEEAKRNAENLTLMESRVLEQTEKMEQTLLTAINDSSEETARAIRVINTTYQNLLDAQKRRTLESLYNEDALVTERRNAAKAFAEGRYTAAARLYGEIATAHPDDQEARFYQYYALFLNNKQDRDNYRIIFDAMSLLERNGYSRREITETLQFIAAETGTDVKKP
jgi:Holliday junction resolvase-like predicted endonuclease